MAGPGDKCEQKTESRGFCNKKVVAMPTKTEGGDRDDSGVEGKGGFARGGTTSRRIYNGMRGEECSVVWRV